MMRSNPRLRHMGSRTDASHVKRITSGGTFRFGRRLLFLATPLEGYDVGLDEVEDGLWSIYFCDVLIARLDERDHIIRS